MYPLRSWKRMVSLPTCLAQTDLSVLQHKKLLPHEQAQTLLSQKHVPAA